MSQSIYSAAVNDAKQHATALGHRVTLEVRNGGARGQCSTCNASLAVLFHSPILTIGLAVEMPCKNGEENAAPKPEAPKPGGSAVKPVRVKAKPASVPSYDDVPFPIDERVPAMAGRK